MHTTEAVLITGVYGSGKSAVAAAMADILERRGERYAYVDLDFLSWGYPGPDDDQHGHTMLLKNLAPVVANYLEVGVRFFVLAGFITSSQELESLRATLNIPLRVVRLTVSLDEVERRLASDVASGSQRTSEAGRQIASSAGVGIEDMFLPNESPVREVAIRIIRWLGWE